MLRHYIYEVKEKFTGEFYWGSRTCKCDPKDDHYMGSMCGWKPNKKNLVKTCIIEYETREKAYDAEEIVIGFYIDKKKFPLNRNYHTTKNWRCQGLKKPEGHQKGEKNSMYGRKRPDTALWNSKTKKGNKYFSGHKHSKSAILKMKIAARENKLGEKNPMYGNGHRVAGEKNGRWHKPVSQETRDKISRTKRFKKKVKNLQKYYDNLSKNYRYFKTVQCIS